MSVFVHGRSGVGKSSLIQRFLEGLFERGEAVILAGRCYEQESVAYKAVDTLIDCALTLYAAAVPARGRRLDASRCIDARPGVSRLAARRGGCRSAAACPRGSRPARAAAAGVRRASRAAARIGDRRPLVLAIDDLQWGDLDSALLLSDLLRPPDPPVLLLLGSYRSEYATVSPFLRVLLHEGGDSLARDQREVPWSRSPSLRGESWRCG